MHNMNRIALTLLAIGTVSTAQANECGVPQTTPIYGELPVSGNSSRSEVAAFVLPYLEFTDSLDTGIIPPGYILIGGVEEFLPETTLHNWTGFNAGVFLNCQNRTIIVAIDHVNISDTPADLIGVITRRLRGGRTVVGPLLVEAVLERYPDHYVTLVGHSAGGNMASYMGELYNLPSILFNASKTAAALTNSGERQIVVTVNGDPISNLGRDEVLLPGLMLRLDVEGSKQFLHSIPGLRLGLQNLAAL